MKNKIIILLGFSLAAISCKTKDNEKDYEGWIVEFPYNYCGKYKIRDTCTCNTEIVWIEKKNYHYGDTIGRMTLSEKINSIRMEEDTDSQKMGKYWGKQFDTLYESK